MNSIQSQSLDALLTNNIKAHLDILEEFNPNCVDRLPTEAEVLSYLSDNEFYKASSQEQLQCLVQNIFRRAKHINHNRDAQTPPILGTNLKTFFPEMQTINYDATTRTWKSVEGMAALVGCRIRSGDAPIFPFALMKLQRESAYPDEALLHEIVVGLVLNNLRSYLPCFMYVYGGFYCSYPKEEKFALSTRANTRQQTSGFCATDAKDAIHSVILAEAVPNHFSLFDFMNSTASADSKNKVFLLVCFALTEANRKFKFVHGDLHSGNVLVRVLAAPVTLSFVYKFPDSKVGIKCKITTRYIPIFIDYGRSCVTYKGIRISPLNASMIDISGKLRDKTDMWCSDANGRPATRNPEGSNCLMENQVFSGVNLPGYDIIRLVKSLNGTDFFRDCPIISRGLVECFYNGVYDEDAHGSVLGTRDNVLKCQLQQIDRTKDPVHNVNCPNGFLNTLILNTPVMQPLLGITPDAVARAMAQLRGAPVPPIPVGPVAPTVNLAGFFPTPAP